MELKGSGASKCSGTNAGPLLCVLKSHRGQYELIWEDHLALLVPASVLPRSKPSCWDDRILSWRGIKVREVWGLGASASDEGVWISNGVLRGLGN